MEHALNNYIWKCGKNVYDSIATNFYYVEKTLNMNMSKRIEMRKRKKQRVGRIFKREHREADNNMPSSEDSWRGVDIKQIQRRLK